jgi:hypothetical protein
LSEENEVIVRFAALSPYAIACTSISGRYVRFHADDRLQARLFRFFLELPRTVKIAVVGYRERGLLELESSGDQVIDAVSAVEK